MILLKQESWLLSPETCALYAPQPVACSLYIDQEDQRDADSFETNHALPLLLMLPAVCREAWSLWTQCTGACS